VRRDSGPSRQSLDPRVLKRRNKKGKSALKRNAAAQKIGKLRANFFSWVFLRL